MAAYQAESRTGLRFRLLFAIICANFEFILPNSNRDFGKEPLMAAYEILREIVGSGCDLTLNEAIAYETLDELAALTKKSGARLTVTTTLTHEMIRKLIQKYGNNIAFIDGLEKFKKD